MFQIRFLQCAEASGDNTLMIHPFYRDSFSALSGIPAERIPVFHGSFPTGNRDFLIGTLSPVMTELIGSDELPSMFYDVRYREDYCQVAPAYSILTGLGLRRTQPLGIKGMHSLSLLQCLQIAETFLTVGTTVLVCCSELPTSLDECTLRKACAFALTIGDSQGLVISEYRKEISLPELNARLREFKDGMLYSEIRNELVTSQNYVSGTLGMIEPFMMAKKCLNVRDKFRIMALLEYQGHYGYYILEQGFVPETG